MELGQLDVHEWQGIQKHLLTYESPFHAAKLYAVRDGVHALLHCLDREEFAMDASLRFMSGPMLAKGELTTLIERGHSRLSKVNILLLVLQKEPADAGTISREDDLRAVDELSGMLLGGHLFDQKVILTVFSCAGREIIRRAESKRPGIVPSKLAKDMAYMCAQTKVVMDSVSQRAVNTALKVGAVVAISDRLNDAGSVLPMEVRHRGAVLEAQLSRELGDHAESKPTGNVTAAVNFSIAQDFIAEVSPKQIELETGTILLDIITDLSNMVAIG